MKIAWHNNIPDCIGEITRGNDSILIQSDFDAPGVADAFGLPISKIQSASFRYAVPCMHRNTDGTVDCPECGLTAREFIAAAKEWLAENDGATADDPGYFS